MKKVRWLRYLIYILVIIGLLILDKYICYKAVANLHAMPINRLALPIMTLLNIAIGVLIGLEHFFAEAKKVGRWKFNWPRALILLVPSLYLIICFTGISYGRILFAPIGFLFEHHLLKIGTDILSVSRLLFGYWLITGFYKNNEAAKITTENER